MSQTIRILNWAASTLSLHKLKTICDLKQAVLEDAAKARLADVRIGLQEGVLEGTADADHAAKIEVRSLLKVPGEERLCMHLARWIGRAQLRQCANTGVKARQS